MVSAASNCDLHHVAVLHRLLRSAFRIGSADIIPMTAVHDLVIYIDADLSMRSRSADCRRLFCRFATTAQYPPISSIVCFPDSGCRPCADEAGLW